MSELPVPSPDTVARRVGDDVVLVHLRTNRIFALNPTGARFWELMNNGVGRREIEATLQQEYDVAPAEVAASIDALLSELEHERLVQPRQIR